MTESSPEHLWFLRIVSIKLSKILVLFYLIPGMLTVAGTGGSGLSRWNQLESVLGIETTYVPVGGGVGK